MFLSPYIEISILDEHCAKIRQLLFARTLLIKNYNLKCLFNLLHQLKYGLSMEELYLQTKSVFKTIKEAEEFINLMTINSILE